MEVDMVLHEGADKEVAVVIPLLRHGDEGGRGEGERKARTAVQLGLVPSTRINRQLGVPSPICTLERIRCPGTLCLIN